MRYDLTDFEWSVIEPLPPRNRRLWVLRTGAPWRDLPKRNRPYTTCYNRFAQSRHLGSTDGRHHKGLRWQGSDDRYVDGPGSSARRRRKKAGRDRCMGRSRGGLTTKLHAIVDAQGRPIRLMLIGGQVHDSHGARELLVDLDSGTIVVGHKAYDADWIRAHVKDQGAVANIPNKANRTHRYRWKKALSRERNVIERFFNRIKHYRRLATRYEKLGANFLAMVQHALVRLWLREIESTT